MATEKYLETHRQSIEAVLEETFARHAIDNRGILTSPRRGALVAKNLVDLTIDYLSESAAEVRVTTKAVQFAEQGMALVTAMAMLKAMNTMFDPEIRQQPKWGELQLLFLQKLAEAREVIQQRAQERSQAALQQALHNQLEQQIASHEVQKQQNETLNRILQLTARLSQTNNEQALLEEAIYGFSEALSVPDISLYTYDDVKQHWFNRVSTAVIHPDDTRDLGNVGRLYNALEKGGETIHVQQHNAQKDILTITIILKAGSRILGGMIINNDQAIHYDNETYLIIIRTFAQNLASQWRNLFLISETQQRTKELEILHGRYLDSIWNSDQAALQAEFNNNQLHISRDSVPADHDHPNSVIPVKIGDYPFGQLQLPEQVTLNSENREFIDVLVREMGSALNNAHFLQTARSYSNQLNVAAEVSRAATTILDRDLLIREVVELIQSRFNLYYVGLFLVDSEEKMVVLHAGTGEAGKHLLAENFTLEIGGPTMIGTAVATGQTRIEPDVRLAKIHTPNPHLPETRAEVALPLRTRRRTIGALTVQSNQTGAFSQEGVTVLQSLVDQLAIAIQNAGLFASTQQNLAESTRLYETSRRINEATTANEIYQALVDFASESGLVDLAQIFAPDPTSPDHLISPAFWSNLGIEHNPEDRFPRHRMPFVERLADNALLQIEDGQTDPEIDPTTRKLFVNNNIRSATIVPIHAEGDWLGSLALDRREAVLLTDQELRPFITLIDQAATILSNQHLLQQSETLYHIGRLLNQAITRDDALEITAREVASYIGAVQCRFVLYEHRDNKGIITAEYGTHGFAESVELPMSGDFVYEHMRQHHTPLLLVEGGTNAPASVIEQHVLAFDAKASLLVPASNQQEVIGYLAIDSQRGTRPFTQTNIIFAQTIVDQLVTQIENLKLLDEALQRAQELITLNQIQTNISHYLDRSQLAYSVYQQVGRLLDNTIFILARYKAETHYYQPILQIVEGLDITEGSRTLQPEEPLYAFLQQNQHLLSDNQTPLARLECQHLPKQPQSGLWIPMRREGETTGLLSVQSYSPHIYDENDVQLLRSIATQANLAIANAELFERIQAHNEELMQVDQLKNQFLANMSHELRTPLNSIIGFSRVILKGIDGPITTEQEEDLTSIYSNGQHLLNLINEILDMAKIEAGKMTLVFEQVDLIQAADAVRKTVKGLINPEKVELVWDIEPETLLIEADPIRIRQILLNLLSNAAKYTAEGQITVTAEIGEESVHLRVSDTGIGIAKEDFDKIFAAFEQADSSTTRAVGGTGLGLPITKWLVEMHQGEIYFESELNKGSTFHVILPFTRDPEREDVVMLTNL